MADVLVVVAQLLALWVPGLIVATCVGLRPWTAGAAAPLMTYGIVTVSAPILAGLGVGWAVGPFLLCTVLLGAAALILRTALRRRTPVADRSWRPSGRDLVIAGGVLGGAVVSLVTLYRGFGGLQAINNESDVQFHANSIRAILDSGNADPSIAWAIVDPAATTGFYPTAYHALAALVTDMTGATIPATMNAHSLLWGLIAGLGLAGLLRSFGLPAVTCAGAALLLPVFSAFPTDLMWWSHLLPFGTAIALIPACLLLISEAVHNHAWARVPVVSLGAVGLLGLHPSAALTAVICVLALLVQRWVGDRSRIAADMRLLAAAALACLVLAPTAVLAAAGSGDFVVASGQQWPARTDVFSAIGDLLLLKHEAAAPMYWLLGLVIVGAGTLARLRALWWWLAASLLFAVLFVMAEASDQPFTEALTLPWWNDSFRFAALAVFGMAVLAGQGLTTLVTFGAVGLRQLSRGRVSRPVAAGAVLLVGLGAFGLLSNGFYSPYNSERMSFRFVESPTLTLDEQEAIAVLGDLVAPGERVMNDPGDGSPWMWALADARPMFPRIVFPGEHPNMSADAQTLFYSFQCLDSDPAVQDVIARYNIGYAYIGEGFARADFTRLYGMRQLEAATSLDLVYRDGEIRIYRIGEPNSAAKSSTVPGCTRT